MATQQAAQDAPAATPVLEGPPHISFQPKVRVAAVAAYSRHDNVGELLISVRHRVTGVLYVAVSDGDGDDAISRQDESVLLRGRLELANEVYRLCATACPLLNVRLLFKDPVSSLSSSSSSAAADRNGGDRDAASLLTRCPEIIFVSNRTQSRYDSQPPPLLEWLQSRCASIYGEPVVERAPSLQPADAHFMKREVVDDQAVFSTSEGALHAYDNVVMGGTFDRLHCGHCLLLTSAALLTRHRLTVGVAQGALLGSKTLRELVEPTGYRIAQIRGFLSDVGPDLQLNAEAITDASGPAGVDVELDCIVVSRETIAGVAPINRQRHEAGLCELSVVSISLVAANCGANKLSSTQARRAGLGRLLPTYVPGRINAPWMTRLQKSVQQNLHNQPVEDIAGFMGDKSINVKLPPPDLLQKTTYVIGLTGGIASGKSSLAAKMKEMYGAAILSCDQLAHQAYMPGTACYGEVLSTFGEDIVNDDGTVNRQRLAEIVFKEPEQLEVLNRIVWPAVARLINDTMIHHMTEGTRIVVVESALLKEAGMDQLVDEIWTMMVPVDEALRRLQANGMSPSQAKARVAAQASNEQRMDYSTVVLSSLWERERTVKEQLVPAWEGLTTRMKCFKIATLGRSFEERFVKVCKSCGVQMQVAREFMASHLNAFHDEFDVYWSGENSVIRKLNQIDYLLPYLNHPSFVLMALFFSRGGLVPPFVDADKVKSSVEMFETFAAAVSLSDKRRNAVTQLLSTGSAINLVTANGDYEYFSDLEVTEDCRLLVLENELGVEKMSADRRRVFHLLEKSPRVMRTPEMDQLLGARIHDRLNRRRH